MASFKSLWLYALIPLSFIAPALGQFAQVTEKDTAGHTWYYPDGAAGAKITVRSDPPTGTVTYATTETSVSTDANGAPVLDAAGKTISNIITTSTTTVVAGRTIPTLVYNCEFMPWICKNIQNHIDNVKAYKFDSNGLMKLHADINSEGRVQSRRKQTCGTIKASTWKQGGFPANCVSAAKDQKITKVVSNEFPDLAAVSQDNLPEVIRGPPDANDPTKFSTFSGLVWTCDEFPSARYVNLPRSCRTAVWLTEETPVGSRVAAVSATRGLRPRSSALPCLQHADINRPKRIKRRVNSKRRP